VSGELTTGREVVEAHLRNADRSDCWTDWPYARRWGEQPTVSCIHPLSGKRWNGPARTLGWFLLHGQWPGRLSATCTTHACWNPHHAKLERPHDQLQDALAFVADDALLAEVTRRGLLPQP
jgi:hypothetical protein